MHKTTRCLLFALAFFIATPVIHARTSSTASRAEAKRARKAKKNKRKKYDKKKYRMRGGKYWRIKTERGPLYVWVPNGYVRKTAGMVIYIHGHHTNVDQAWKYHKLAEQFRMSRQNAIFVVPEAPINGRQPVHWPSLAKLKRAISRAGIRMPDGPTIVVGHSGAFRTIKKWVDHRVLAQVILLDSLYGGSKQFFQFIHSSKRAKHHKLILVTANDTMKKTKRFLKKLKYAAIKERFPKSFRGFSRRERNSRVLFVRSQYGHMALVTNKKVIPLILRVTPLKRL